jgi:hypothetical protein
LLKDKVGYETPRLRGASVGTRHIKTLIMSEILSFRTPSIVLVLKNKPTKGNTTFRKLDLFPSSGAGKIKPILLGPLERASPNHWMRTETDPVSETSCFP